MLGGTEPRDPYGGDYRIYVFRFRVGGPTFELRDTGFFRDDVYFIGDDNANDGFDFFIDVRFRFGSLFSAIFARGCEGASTGVEFTVFTFGRC